MNGLRRVVGGERWPRTVFAGLLLVAATGLFLHNQVYFAPRRVHVEALGLRRLDGSAFDWGGLGGRPVVLNFWAPWCPPCRTEMPALQQLQDEHPEALVLGIEDDPEVYAEAETMAQESRIRFPLVRSNAVVRSTFGALDGLPTTLYLSRTGRVVHTAIGPVHLEAMRRYLASAAAAR